MWLFAKSVYTGIWCCHLFESLIAERRLQALCAMGVTCPREALRQNWLVTLRDLLYDGRWELSKWVQNLGRTRLLDHMGVDLRFTRATVLTGLFFSRWSRKVV